MYMFDTYSLIKDFYLDLQSERKKKWYQAKTNTEYKYSEPHTSHSKGFA